MTSAYRRITVLVGALCAASLSLALAADAATAATSTERARKQRRRATADQELDKAAPAWPSLPLAGVGLPPARVRQPDAAAKPVVDPADAADDASVTLAIVRRARHVGLRGSYKKPYPPGTPASPSR